MVKRPTLSLARSSIRARFALGVAVVVAAAALFGSEATAGKRAPRGYPPAWAGVYKDPATGRQMARVPVHHLAGEGRFRWMLKQSGVPVCFDTRQPSRDPKWTYPTGGDYACYRQVGIGHFPDTWAGDEFEGDEPNQLGGSVLFYEGGAVRSLAVTNEQRVAWESARLKAVCDGRGDDEFAYRQLFDPEDLATFLLESLPSETGVAADHLGYVAGRRVFFLTYPRVRDGSRLNAVSSFARLAYPRVRDGSPEMFTTWFDSLEEYEEGRREAIKSIVAILRRETQSKHGRWPRSLGHVDSWKRVLARYDESLRARVSPPSPSEGGMFDPVPRGWAIGPDGKLLELPWPEYEKWHLREVESRALALSGNLDPAALDKDAKVMAEWRLHLDMFRLWSEENRAESTTTRSSHVVGAMAALARFQASRGSEETAARIAKEWDVALSAFEASIGGS